MAFKFRRLEIGREDIYDLPKTTDESPNRIATPEIVGSSIYSRAVFDSGLEPYHDFQTILTLEEQKQIIEICEKAAIRTAKTLHAAANEMEKLRM